MGEYELYKQEQDVRQGGMRQIYEHGMKKLRTLYSSEKRPLYWEKGGGHKRRNRKGIRQAQKYSCKIWKKCTERPHVGGASIRSRNDAPSPKGCVVNG